jgi:hypothetical protein
MILKDTLQLQSNMPIQSPLKQSPVLKGHLFSCPVIENFI